MKFKNIVLAFFIIASFTSVVAHKYYVSITEITYVKEQQSVQIITRIFIDDFQRLLRERYDDKVTLDDNQDEEAVNKLMNKYIKSRLLVNINSEVKQLNFIGKEYDTDIVYLYYEIENVQSITSMEIKNTVLFDIFSDQKNVVRTNIKNSPKTFILIPENNKGLLNFN